MGLRMHNEIQPQNFTILGALWHDKRIEDIWSSEGCIRAWLRVEGQIAHAQAQSGIIEQEIAELIVSVCESINIDADRFWQETRLVGYPILPLITQLTEALPREAAGKVHYGVTTQDVMDSGLALQLVLTAEHLEHLLVNFGNQLVTLSERFVATMMAGRTHSQQAVPITFGGKIAVFLEQVRQELVNLRRARNETSVVSLFGAAGTSAAMGTSAATVRAALAQALGLRTTDVPWHVARGNVVRFGQCLTTISAVCVRFAREIVDLSRTEIGEVRERSGHHRGASSTMPQKANPISCEAIIGFGISAYAVASSLLRSMETGHERSSGEWQVEWFSLPTLVQLTASAIGLSTEVASGLEVFPDRMAENLKLDHGLISSEALMMHLAPVLGRDHAHEVVYQSARHSRQDGIALTDSVREILPAEEQGLLEGFSADSYLGDEVVICRSAVAHWKAEIEQLTGSQTSLQGLQHKEGSAL